MILSQNQREGASILRTCCLWFASPEHEPAGGEAPPLKIATRRSRERIVIYQRVSKAWADSNEGALAVGLVI